MTLPTLEIESTGDSLRQAVVRLDGMEIRGLTGLHLQMSVNDFNHATLVINVGEVRCDAATLAALQAVVDSPKHRGRR